MIYLLTTREMFGSQILVSSSRTLSLYQLPNGSLEYSWFNALVETAPQLETATYRFRPSTGAVNIVEDSIIQPNGIAIAPKMDNCSTRTVYITDTGAVTGTILQSLGPQGSPFNTTGKRTVYAYDLSENGNQLLNKRPINLSQDWVPDGLKVAANGYVRKSCPSSALSS